MEPMVTDIFTDSNTQITDGDFYNAVPNSEDFVAIAG